VAGSPEPKRWLLRDRHIHFVAAVFDGGRTRAETGTPFLLASGPALPAGAQLTLQLANLPVHSQTPRLVALALAAAILGFGAWLAFARPSTRRDPRPRLIQRRDALLAELAALEGRRKTGEHADEVRRRRLLAELEQIYGELDEAGGRPRGGGEDVAA
jgi:hypothetical protein